MGMKGFSVLPFARGILTVLLIVLLTGCGFHLRGDHNLPDTIGPVQITGVDRLGRFHRTLRYALLDNGIAVANGGEAKTQILLRDYRGSQFVTALDQEGKAAEYELSRTVTFSLRDKATGRELISPQELERRALYTDEPLAGFGITLQRREVIEQLDEQLVDDILTAISLKVR